ncbi:MAG: phenylalanine--tRNA ligase subunit beta [Bdellovibrionaceae bacterium]|nr:phenylalanine--tRNA ligase subunit beta [Pseudobdellovibrionaceae bacterium]
MKISLKWLQDFVDVADYMNKPEALGALLTGAGLEVEEINNKSKDFANVVVGLILTKDKHPNADKLSLCQVTTGEGVVHQIVCGAQNHKANDRVIVALPGAVLPGNFAIKKAVVRGVESGGMLCSLKELGLAKESDGIEILPAEAPIGKPFAEYKGLDDVTFELKVTPNRADCLSHFGLAREVSCLLDRPLKKHIPDFGTSERSTKEQVKLSVQDAEACPRYCGRFISGVKVGPSPAWLASRLEAVGLNSINNVVDVTNYVMLELGQPLHAFDAREVRGNQIIVAKGKAGEIFKTLDGTEKKLTGEELMIQDGERNVAMAGVVGGQNSGVSESTTEIFLEAAYFEPSAVRKASRLHGIQTDSAYRFTRGVDPDGTLNAMDRAAELILKVAGGTAFSQPHDFYPKPVKKSPVVIKLATVSQRLGYQADAKLFETYMTRLGCGLEKMQAEGAYQILPPTFRFDLEMEMDLVEEYARLNGYDKIPESLPVSSERPAAHDLNYRLRQKLSRLMRSEGYFEAQNYAFVGEKNEKDFLKNFTHLSGAGLLVSEKPIKLLNPLSDDINVMRSTLSMSLWKNALDNYRQGNETGRLFEIGKTFELKDGAFIEHWRLGLIAWGFQTSLWTQNPTHAVVLELKAALQEVLTHFGISSFKFSPLTDRSQTPDFLHRGQFAVVEKENAKIGFLGSLHPVLVNDEKVRTQVALAEIELEPLFKGQPRLQKYSDFSRFPKIERDVALLMPKSLAVADVTAEIKKAGGAKLVQVQVFDQYIGDKVPAGQRSVAFRLVFQDDNGTLQDDVVQGAMKAILDSVGQKWGLTTR